VRAATSSRPFSAAEALALLEAAFVALIVSASWCWYFRAAGRICWRAMFGAPSALRC
jgi:hypothetical protein